MTENTTTTTTPVEATTGAGTSTDAGTEVAAKITNLSAARREQSAMLKAAKESHPAGTEQPEKPALQVTMKERREQAEKPAAKKASPAKAAATKKDAKPAVATGAKLRWTKVDDTDAAVALTEDGSYSLLPHEGKWKVEWRKGSKVTVLVSGIGRTAAYKAAVTHNQTGEVPKAKKATA